MARVQDTGAFPSHRQLIALALPLAGGMLSQSLINLVDTALVGHLGGLALASVSIGSYLAFVLTALLVGLNHGVQNNIAQLANNASRDVIGIVYTGMLLGLLLAGLLILVGWFCAPWMINLLVVDDRINTLAEDYFFWRLLGLPLVALSLCLRAFWSGTGTVWPFLKLLFAVHIVNAILSYGLVYGALGLPAMGASGAGLGTTLSIGLGVLLNLWLIHRRQSQMPENSRCSLTSYYYHASGIIRLGWPASLQQLQFTVHLLILFLLVSQLGASALAVTFVVLNVGLLLILPSIGMGQATMTLVGQALGNNQFQLAHRWGKFVALRSLMLGIIIAVLINIFNQYIISSLIVNPALQTLAASALQIYALALAIDSVGMVLGRAMMARGNGPTALLIGLIGQWGLFLPLIWFVTPSYGFIAIWWCQLGYRVCTSILMWFFWQHNVKSFCS